MKRKTIHRVATIWMNTFLALAMLAMVVTAGLFVILGTLPDFAERIAAMGVLGIALALPGFVIGMATMR